jgi:acetolactate synthase I/II/III large subunit
MKVGDRLAQLLLENGVDKVFGVPGGQTLPLYEGISKFQGAIEHVLMRDERSAGYAADAYARMTGKTGVCDGTVGPGATNLISPLAEAHCSSIPLICIISDVARAWEHRRTRGNASQAMDQMEMFKPVSKWQVRITDPKSLDNIIDHAFRVATSGKPGPVVVCIPEDVAGADFEFRDPVAGRDGATYPATRSAPDPTSVSEAAAALGKATKPILVVGGGAHISGAGEQVRELAEVLNVPVVTSISGKGIIAEDHANAFGVTGTFGSPVARDLVKQSDLVVFIGCKAGQLTTYSYRCPSRNTQIIHLDSDPEEIGRNYANSISLVADARLGLDALLTALGGKSGSYSWDFAAPQAQYQAWYQENTDPDQADNEPVKPPTIMGVVNQVLSDDDVVVCDASLASGWAASYLKFTKPGRRMMAPRGLAGLGWGSPAAIGAALATKRKQRILHFAGDGGFSYSMQEMEVMSRFKLPILTIILNNDTLGWIKHVQRDHYDQNYVSTDFSHIDFAVVAGGFGLRSYRVTDLAGLRECLDKEANPEGPALIEVISDQWSSPVQSL